MSGHFYITTPIYYVNDVPHLGTAYTTVVADAVRRFHLLRGDHTRMLTGTDEHGLKIEREAIAKGMSPQTFVDDVSARFRAAWPELDVEADDFIRTTEPRHIAWVQELWKKIDEPRAACTSVQYDEWYCVGCESYKTEKELLPGNVCAIHLKPVERVQEPSYFFRLSEWEKPLLDFYERHPRLHPAESAGATRCSRSCSPGCAISACRAPASSGASRFPATTSTSCTSGSTRWRTTAARSARIPR